MSLELVSDILREVNKHREHRWSEEKIEKWATALQSEGYEDGNDFLGLREQDWDAMPVPPPVRNAIKALVEGAWLCVCFGSRAANGSGFGSALSRSRSPADGLFSSELQQGQPRRISPSASYRSSVDSSPPRSVTTTASSSAFPGSGHGSMFSPPRNPPWGRSPNSSFNESPGEETHVPHVRDSLGGATVGFDESDLLHSRISTSPRMDGDPHTRTTRTVTRTVTGPDGKTTITRERFVDGGLDLDPFPPVEPSGPNSTTETKTSSTITRSSVQQHETVVDGRTHRVTKTIRDGVCTTVTEIDGEIVSSVTEHV